MTDQEKIESLKSCLRAIGREVDTMRNAKEGATAVAAGYALARIGELVASAFDESGTKGRVEVLFPDEDDGETVLQEVPSGEGMEDKP